MYVAKNTANKVTASGTNTALADVKPIGTGPCAGLNFATVADGVATFCATPSAAGAYKVMLANAEAILFGAAAADALVLDMSLAAYSGTVASLLDGYTATAGEPVDGVTTWTLVASYPSYLADADAAVKAAYDAWAQANGTDTASAYENQFLLNATPATDIPATALVITRIEQNATAGWDVTVGCSVAGVGLSGTVNTARVGNGYLSVSYANELGGEGTTENIAITANNQDGTVTVNVNKANARFMKVAILATTAVVGE